MPDSYANDPKCKIAQVIRNRAPISRADVARVLAMSPATTGRMVDQLIAQDVIKETGQTQENRSGRPSIALEFNLQFGSIITVDLRLTKAYGALTDMAGNILAREVRQLTVGNPGQSVVQLKSLLHSFSDLQIDAPPLKAIAIGAPSLVDVNTGTLEWAPSLDWEALPLGQILQDEFGVPVLVENDVNLTALGEFWKGAGQTSNNNMVFVSIGTGIGAGIFLNGELYRGATNAAGEVGYFIADLDIFRHSASKIGHLENRIGRDGIIELAYLVAQRYPTSELAKIINQQKDRFRTRDIFAAVANDDPAAQTVFNQIVDHLTIVVANLSVVLDPEVIVLGGPSDWPWPILIEAVQERIGSNLLRPINLQPSVLGHDALIMGGAFATLNLKSVLPC
jgi:predicted NBD/HSP70 family sugar kinase